MSNSRDQRRLVFALDIGTRKVAGVLVELSEDGPNRLIAAEVIEHETRSMQDGQIHDIGSVARVIASVKEQVEQATGETLTAAAVAAAGRALKTATASASCELLPTEAITRQTMVAVEMEAVQSARRDLVASAEAKQRLSERHHCVGYTVLEHRIDGNPIQNPIGQRGSNLDADVIATFLPRIVVDSLCTAVEEAGLSVASMTLEPIAAINVAIQRDMRRLNLVLVDVGAGTSDIAVTAGGRVFAYGMVPMAGDEVTEAISETYLLDFLEAEKAKRALSDGGKVKITDLLGVETEVDTEEILDSIDPCISELAARISESIKELNGKAPQAVVCIGGGSLTPGLLGKLSENLGISPARVGIRGSEVVKGLESRVSGFSGPMAVTSIGIALASEASLDTGFFSIRVNGQTLQLMDVNTPTVADALVSSGLGLRHLHGRPGKGITVRVNGELRVFKGSPGRPATILRNGSEANLDDPVTAGDQLSIDLASDGTSPRLRVGELVVEETPRVSFRGETLEVEPEVVVNGKKGSLNDLLRDNDEVLVAPKRSVRGVLEERVSSDEVAISYTINGHHHTSLTRRRLFTVDGSPVPCDYEVRDGDDIDYSTDDRRLTMADVVSPLSTGKAAMTVTLNGEPVEFSSFSETPVIICNGKQVSLDCQVQQGDEITVEVSGRDQFILADLLSRDEASELLEAARRKRGHLVLSVNGQPAEFCTTLSDGDEVRIEIR